MLAPDILSSPILGETNQGYVNSFLNSNKTPELRHDKLVRVIDPKVAAPPHLGQPSHALFLAHWGESNDTINKVGSWLYNTKDTTDGSIGESIMVFRQGSPASLEGDDLFIEDYLVIETGCIATNEKGLSEFFHGLQQGKPRPDIKGPSARFFSKLSVLDRQTVTVDMLPSVSAIQNEGLITLYDGVIPLDVEEYDSGRDTTVYHAAIGNLACFELLEKLASRASLRAGQNFAEMLETGEVVPTDVLPDLRLIFQPVEQGAFEEDLFEESA